MMGHSQVQVSGLMQRCLLLNTRQLIRSHENSQSSLTARTCSTAGSANGSQLMKGSTSVPRKFIHHRSSYCSENDDEDRTDLRGKNMAK